VPLVAGASSCAAYDNKDSLALYLPILEKHPELAELIERWADLPDVTKGLILAAVKTPS